MSLKEKLKHLFVPHAENGFKPNFLERFSMSIMLLLVLLSFAIANLQSLLWISSDWMVSSILPAVIVDLTNKERDGESLGALHRNATLDRAAQLKAEDMAKHEYFAHYSPTGVSPWYWFDQASYSFVHAGENLAVHFTDSGEVVDAWMDSPSHRANIMNNSFTEIGIGAAKGTYKGTPTIFVVQLFGTPAKVTKASTPVTQVAEAAEVPVVDPVTVEKITAPSATKTGTAEVAPATIDAVPQTPASPATSAENTNVTAPVAEDAPIYPAAEPAPVPTEVEQSSETPTSLYSDLATTSRLGVPAEISGQSSGTTAATPFVSALEKGATQPSLWLQLIYGILGSVVVVALILSVVIEWRKQHPVQLAYATGLLAAMALLFHFHTVLTSGVTII